MTSEAEKSEREPERSQFGWQEFFHLAEQMDVHDDFLFDRGDTCPQERDLF
jgi:hypothetical protein